MKTAAMMLKDLRLICRDRFGLIALLIVPIVVIMVVASATQSGDGSKSILFPVVNEDQGPVATALIRAFREVHGNVVLCIAGKPNSDTLATELRREAAADPRVLLHLYDVPNERVQLFFHAADLVVLPYRDILNSGTALLSMSFNRPVLVPDRGAMEDLRERVGRQWIRTFVGEINALVLQQALAWATQASRPSEACLRELEWPKLADQTLRAYQDVIARRRQPRLRDSSNSRLLTASLAEQFHTERS